MACAIEKEIQVGKLKSLMKKQIHQRDITASTFEVDETCIIVQGVIMDKSLDSIYKISGEKSPPSVYHHMEVIWLIKVPEMQIVDVEVEMPTVPVNECLETKNMLKKIIGVYISGSFTRNISTLYGGTKGCAHIKSLLLLMGTTAIQGYWCLISRDKEIMEQQMKQLTHFIKDTCHVWRENGDVFKTYGN